MKLVLNQFNLSQQLGEQGSQLLPIFEDPQVTDLMINGTESMFIEKAGRLERLPNPFDDIAKVYGLIERILVPLGGQRSASCPYFDGRLADGSRVHGIYPPLAPQGPHLSIRFARAKGGGDFGSAKVLEWLKGQVIAGKNCLISGATGSGKTTLLTTLLDSVPHSERIVLVEESSEIQLSHPHAIALQSDSGRKIDLGVLIRNALRMRPDRIVLGEIRGAEGFHLLHAMNTGHRGGICTIHANSVRDALFRWESLAAMDRPNIPMRTLQRWIGSAVDIVVQLCRQDEARVIEEVGIVQGVEGEVYRIASKKLCSRATPSLLETPDFL